MVRKKENDFEDDNFRCSKYKYLNQLLKYIHIEMCFTN